MYYRKWFLVLSAIFILSACATKVDNIKKDVPSNQLDSNEGYLMLTVDTNTDLQRILINGSNSIEVGREDVRRGSNHILVALPAGQYYIERITTRNIWGLRNHFDFDEDEALDWRFNVAVGTVSYVGQLRIESSFWGGYSSFVLVNQASQAQEYLEQNFPALLNNHRVVYQGPGEDNFFDVIRSMPNKEMQ